MKRPLNVPKLNLDKDADFELEALSLGYDVEAAAQELIALDSPLATRQILKKGKKPGGPSQI